MTHIRNSIIGAVSAMTAYIIVVLFWWLIFPYQTASVVIPIEVYNAKRVDGNLVVPNREIILKIIVSKETNARAINIETIVHCGFGAYGATPVDTTARNLPRGEFVRIRTFKISDDAPIDQDCHLQFDLDYQVNPIRTIHKTLNSEIFQIGA